MQDSITDWLVQAVGNTLDLLTSASVFILVDIFYVLSRPEHVEASHDRC